MCILQLHIKRFSKVTDVNGSMARLVFISKKLRAIYLSDTSQPTHVQILIKGDVRPYCTLLGFELCFHSESTIANNKRRISRKISLLKFEGFSYFLSYILLLQFDINFQSWQKSIFSVKWLNSVWILA